MKNTILLILLLTGTIIHAQNQEFNSITESINTTLEKVESGKYQYGQRITVLEPGIVTLEITKTTIKDGKTDESVYQLNLADVDKNTVRTTTKKDLITIQLLAGKKQQLFKRIENGEKITYENEITLYALDIENGRALENLIKEAIPIAENITENRLSLNSYNEHIEWLKNNIGDVNLIKKQYAQAMTGIDSYPGKIAYTTSENNGKSATSELFHFNASTINPNSILFSVEGEVFAVTMETSRKLKLIKAFEEGIQENYTNKLKVVCESVEQARDFQKVMKELISLSTTGLENSLQKISSVTNGISNTNKLIEKIVINDTSISQNLSGDCVVTFQQNFENSDKNNVNEFTFNFKDLNKNSVNYTTKGQNVIISIDTNGGNKFIKHTEDGEQKNFTDELEFFVAEVEDAIVLKNTLQDIIELCNQEKPEFAGFSNADKLKKLEENLVKVTINDVSYEQLLNSVSLDEALNFKKIKVTSKSSDEEIFEFNLKDINPASVKMNTSGKNVSVTASTYYLEKIIKYYENGEIENYQNTIEIEANDIENARRIKLLLEAIAGKTS